MLTPWDGINFDIVATTEEAMEYMAVVAFEVSFAGKDIGHNSYGEFCSDPGVGFAGAVDGDYFISVFGCFYGFFEVCIEVGGFEVCMVAIEVSSFVHGNSYAVVGRCGSAFQSFTRSLTRW